MALIETARVRAMLDNHLGCSDFDLVYAVEALFGELELAERDADGCGTPVDLTGRTVLCGFCSTLRCARCAKCGGG